MLCAWPSPTIAARWPTSRRWPRTACASATGLHHRHEQPDMNTFDELKRNLEQVGAAIEGACRRAQRSRSEITLIAVTKMHPAAAIAAAAELGVTHIGENKVQEFDSKQPEWIPLRDSHKLHAHLIG